MSAAATAEGSFLGAGARRIVWRRWPATGAAPRGIVAIVHGWAEHSGRYAHVGERLGAAGYEVYALDHHGHGRSAGTRARISFPAAVADLDLLVALAASRHPDTATFMLGHSMGGALALRYALDHGDRLSGLIISAPLIQIDGRAAAKALAPLIGAVAPGLPVSRVDPALISRDPAVVAAYRDDPLVHHGPVAAATAAEFLRHAATLPDAVSRITVPALLTYGTADRLCDPAGCELVARRLGSADLTCTPYAGLHHELLNEPERDRVLDDVISWLAARTPDPDDGARAASAPPAGRRAG